MPRSSAFRWCNLSYRRPDTKIHEVVFCTATSSGSTARPPHDPRAEVGAIAERIDRHPGRWDRPTADDAANRDRKTAGKNLLSLSTGVGRNQPNRGRDVVSVKNALSWLGHYPADKARRADPTPDDDLLWGLQDFQRAFGLARDGFSLPGGETERKLDDLVQPMIQLAAADGRVRSDAAAGLAMRNRATGDGGGDAKSGPSKAAGSDPGAVQVADATGHRPSGWGNPSAWALGEAGKQVGDSVGNAGKAVKDGALDAAEEALRQGADAGRAHGLDNAADSLDHFLDGSGKDRAYSRDQARERPFIREAEEKSRERFVDSLMKNKSTKLKGGTVINYNYRDQIMDLKDGESRQILPDKLKDDSRRADYWEVEGKTLGHVLGGDIDEALAFGSNELTSNLQDGFTATRKGDTITVTGVVNHEWSDRYDFDGESSPDPVMNSLRDSGRAAEFDSRAAWAQKMTVRLKITDGGLTLDPNSVEWRDLESEAGP
ncbi:hypothetical protein KAJ83_08555 [Marivibrio halodurans]|uniref:Peptidoglycan binding domain-containing protein n=1 Tax=Marivibrio halodurans TaxID=2039722 RepID=A0A8J7RYH2_9PROT|nr:peptidoglycan-binding domain-containing protein [Marivibrio halodurans]MBP5857057.1 hypothetical protein [Marivibrio halodurans]